MSLTIGVTPFVLTQRAAGQWSAHAVITQSIVPPLATNINAQLVARRHDVATASITIPLTITH